MAMTLKPGRMIVLGMLLAAVAGVLGKEDASCSRCEEQRDEVEAILTEDANEPSLALIQTGAAKTVAKDQKQVLPAPQGCTPLTKASFKAEWGGLLEDIPWAWDLAQKVEQCKSKPVCIDASQCTHRWNTGGGWVKMVSDNLQGTVNCCSMFAKLAALTDAFNSVPQTATTMLHASESLISTSPAVVCKTPRCEKKCQEDLSLLIDFSPFWKIVDNLSANKYLCCSSCDLPSSKVSLTSR
jgi:hypothetical protein